MALGRLQAARSRQDSSRARGPQCEWPMGRRSETGPSTTIPGGIGRTAESCAAPASHSGPYHKQRCPNLHFGPLLSWADNPQMIVAKTMHSTSRSGPAKDRQQLEGIPGHESDFLRTTGRQASALGGVFPTAGVKPQVRRVFRSVWSGAGRVEPSNVGIRTGTLGAGVTCPNLSTDQSLSAVGGQPMAVSDG